MEGEITKYGAYILMGVLIVSLALVGGYLFEYPPPPPPPPVNFSFSALCADKKGFYESAIWDHWFENGTVIWHNETDRMSMAVIAPLPLPIGDISNFTDRDYVAVKYSAWMYNGPLQVGDVVNVSGVVKQAQKDGQQVYYLDAAQIVKTGQMSISDPDFASILQVVQYDQRVHEEMDAMLIIIWFFFLMPAMMGDD